MGARVRTEGGGVRFVSVPVGSAGHRAGFCEGDTLTHMNGAATSSVDALTGIISGAAYGETKFRVLRGSKVETILTDGPGGVPAKVSP